jgi:hypothetical protein
LQQSERDDVQFHAPSDGVSSRLREIDGDQTTRDYSRNCSVMRCNQARKSRLHAPQGRYASATRRALGALTAIASRCRGGKAAAKAESAG